MPLSKNEWIALLLAFPYVSGNLPLEVSKCHTRASIRSSAWRLLWAESQNILTLSSVGNQGNSASGCLLECSPPPGSHLARQLEPLRHPEASSAPAEPRAHHKTPPLLAQGCFIPFLVLVLRALGKRSRCCLHLLPFNFSQTKPLLDHILVIFLWNLFLTRPHPWACLWPASGRCSKNPAKSV